VQRVLIVAAAVAIAGVGLTGCASSAHHASASRADTSSAPGGDTRLLGTWQVSEALDGPQTIHADAGTYEYLVFKADGAVIMYEGDSTERWAWSAADGQLKLQPADGGSDYTELGSDAAARISIAFSKLLTSRRIAYQVNAAEMTLSGTSRLYEGDLADPAASPTTPPPATPVRISFTHVNGPPPAPPTAQLPTGPSTSRPAKYPFDGLADGDLTGLRLM
jgi:hypothetical protein